MSPIFGIIVGMAADRPQSSSPPGSPLQMAAALVSPTVWRQKPGKDDIAIPHNFTNERKLQLIDGIWTMRSGLGNKLLKEINPTNMKGLTKEKVVNQIKNLINDEKKNKWAVNNGYKMLRFWENDINNNISIVKEILLKNCPPILKK